MKLHYSLLTLVIAFITGSNMFAADGTESTDANRKESNNSSQKNMPTFEAMQKIHLLAAAVAKQAKAKDGTTFLHDRKEFPAFNANKGQTKQGLYLLVEHYPVALKTPWGEVPIYPSVAYNYSARGNIYDEFRKHLKLEFVRNACEGADKWPVRTFNPADLTFYADNDEKPITEQELEKYRGTDAGISASYCGCPSIYKITEIDGVKLPHPEERSYNEYRCTNANHSFSCDDDEIRNEWKTLTERYEKQRILEQQELKKRTEKQRIFEQEEFKKRTIETVFSNSAESSL